MKTIDELRKLLTTGKKCDGVQFGVQRVEVGGMTLIDSPSLAVVDVIWLHRLLAEIETLRPRVEPLDSQSGADLSLFCLVGQHLGAKHPNRAAEAVGFNTIIGLLIEVEAAYARLPVIDRHTEGSP